MGIVRRKISYRECKLQGSRAEFELINLNILCSRTSMAYKLSELE